MCIYLILNQPLNLKNVLFLICLGELPVLRVWKVWSIQKSGKNSTLSSCMLGILHLDVRVVTTSPHLPSFFLYSLDCVFVAARGLSLVAVSRGYSLVVMHRLLTASLLQSGGFSCCRAWAVRRMDFRSCTHFFLLLSPFCLH